MTPTVAIAIAGDYTLHSQALKDTESQLKGAKDKSPHRIAQLYGRAIQSINLKRAEDRFLAPLGLNTDSFLAQQHDMTESFVNSLREQLQSHGGADVEAIVIGTDTDRVQLYVVDREGSALCYDDVGFAAIGSGGDHARSRLMQSGYASFFNLSRVLAATFAAKKSAETAPGVGSATDIHLIKRDGIFPLWPHVHAELHRLYEDYEKQRLELATNAVDALQKFLDAPTDDERKSIEEGKSPRGDTQADGGTDSDEAETPRKDENRSENEAG